MVAGSYSIEIESPVDAKRLWNATLDIHNLLPKQAPWIISAITLLQGDGGVGTIRQVNFTAANTDFSYVKEKVDLIDEGQYGGGSISATTRNYDSLPFVPYDEAKIEEIKANSFGLFRILEGYLIANPTLYC
ncbi:major allergen Pru ar 1-like [Cryptomeria japonica]|uniref:major allergen Pru ar 1-like n=1 Tax=Cryptomeria japonica TaxID=3369 RepID=UPI0027DA6897|nr:major allergen Pru ar 1-like [Cryptomeria japonica]